MINVEQISHYLQVPHQPPSLPYLDELVAAYVQTVPWETASRLSRQQTISDPQKRAQTAVQFWENALNLRIGGTCFESNGAFFALLQQLGFEGYLTINDMKGECGCHTACIILWEGEKWLVDVGYPLYLPVRLTSNAPSTRLHPVHDFTASPLGNNRYEITRNRHPDPYIFTLIDEPVTADAYAIARRDDYLPSGYFNKEFVVRILKGEETWVYNGRQTPPTLESFTPDMQKREHPLQADLPAQLHKIFALDQDILRTAFAVLRAKENG